MPKVREAGAGRGFVNPKPVNVSDEDYITPEARYEMETRRREMREADAAKKAEDRAYGMKKGGKVGSASKRADGIAQRGKTRGTIVMCKGGMYK